MNKKKITLEEIEDSLCEVDSEYRESLARALMKLKYLSDSPLKLSLGTEKQQQELKNVMSRSLKANQIKEIMSFISNEMKGDFQYHIFANIASKYIDLANKMNKNIER